MTITALPPAPVHVDVPRDDWRDDALCAQTDPEAFFPAVGESVATIRGICGRCPVQWECLADAIDVTDGAGFRAGLSPKHRTKLRTLGYNRAAVLAAGRAGVPILLARARTRR